MAILQGIRRPDVDTMEELYKLTPEDSWIVHVNDVNMDYYYDGEKKTWVSFACEERILTADRDKKVISNRLMFETIDLNMIVLYVMVTICIVMAVAFSSAEIALTLAGILAGRTINNMRK